MRREIYRTEEERLELIGIAENQGERLVREEKLISGNSLFFDIDIAKINKENAGLWYQVMANDSIDTTQNNEIADIWYEMMTGGIQ